ncbi:uncharacterized protein LOC135491409 [Lineus longissimus]|uniref:uncharacterized protein LOC135491409 n=1 Tax=Lineus longissimus TaxID=88925 RepID=UPI002B4C8F1F
MDPFVAHLQEVMRAELAKFPLNVAAREGRIDTVVALVEAGVSVNSADANGYTALNYAEIMDNTEMIECLVGLGADITLKDKMRMDVLFNAVISEHCDVVKCLVRHGADPNTNDGEVTPLHRAASLNMLDMVKLLVELGADVNVRTVKGCKWAPLRHAVAGNHVQMVKLLVDLGADMNQRDLIDINAICAAASDGKWEVVECLASLGADLDASSLGLPPISFAVNLGMADAARTLVKYGAKLNRTDLQWSLLIRTVTNHDEATLAVLLDGGMEPDLGRYEGMSPLFYSATLGNGSATNMLIKAGACVNFTNPQGMTPLHGSCTYGHTDVARLLLLAGSDINKTDDKGRTPISCLPFQDVVDYSLERRWLAMKNLVENTPLDTIPDVTCPPLEQLHIIPGIGNVLAIPGGLAKQVFADVKAFIGKLPAFAGDLFTGVKLQQVGSSGEETRTGLPNEMDFIFQVNLGFDNRAVKEVGYGYALVSYPVDAKSAYRFAFWKGSKSFHDIFNDIFEKFKRTSEDVRVRIMEDTEEVIKETDRKACTPMMICREDEESKERVAVSVDAVPCIHINDWPENGTRQTWLMDYATLKGRGYNLIPKTPNANSEIARGFSPKDLEELWRISFSHLETEHMYNVIPRVKAVYVTAKCLRNPDVCQILIRDQGAKLKTAESYVVSYLLKMMFFQRVEEFQSTEHSLGKMVCQLFDDVADGLTRNFIPLFFIPSINVLDGLKLDIFKCAAVARIMSRFVKALFSRDLATDVTDVTDDITFKIYQRDKPLYKIYDIGDIGRSTQDGEVGLQMLNIEGAVGEDSTVENADSKMAKLLAVVTEFTHKPDISKHEKAYNILSALDEMEGSLKKSNELLKDSAKSDPTEPLKMPFSQ